MRSSQVDRLACDDAGVVSAVAVRDTACVRLAWATDVHLNFLPPHEVNRFADTIAAAEPDALVLSGDIAEAPSLEHLLPILARRLDRPVYFASRLRGMLAEALAGFDRVVVATHVPPFHGATWHDGRPSDNQWLPWFSCAATGEVLLEAAAAHPDRELLVLCGHTHGSGEYAPTGNLRVLTGGAVYGAPELQRTFDC